MRGIAWAKKASDSGRNQKPMNPCTVSLYCVTSQSTPAACTHARTENIALVTRPSRHTLAWCTFSCSPRSFPSSRNGSSSAVVCVCVCVTVSAWCVCVCVVLE